MIEEIFGLDNPSGEFKITSCNFENMYSNFRDVILKLEKIL
jgi:hypothetical protein